MPVVTSVNRARWMAEEMARRAGKKLPQPESVNPFEGMTSEQLKQQKALLKDAMKEIKEIDK